MAERALRPKGPTASRFERILKDGKCVRETGFRLFAAPGVGLLGIATSRKIGGKPQRNRARRRMREAIRLSTVWDARYDWVMVVGTPACSESLDTLSIRWADATGKMRRLWEGGLACS